MPLSAHPISASLVAPIAAQIAAMTPLWARESALDHRNLVIADEAPRRLEAADALAVETAKTAVRVAITVADPAAVNQRLAALRSRDLGDLRVLSSSEAVDTDDRAIVRGSFDLIVISTQRLGDLLTRAPQLAESLGMVILDSVQALLNPLTSAPLDRVLTLLRSSALPPRLVALGDPQAPMTSIARWLDASIEGGPEQLGLACASGIELPQLPEIPLDPVVLQMIATGRADHAGELRRMVLTSFAGHVCYRHLSAAGDAREGFSNALDAALDRCLKAGLIAYRTGHGLVATEAGRVCLGLGLDLHTLHTLEGWVRSLSSAAPSLLELCVQVARTRAGSLAALPEGPEVDSRAQVLDTARSLGVADRPVFRWLRDELWSFGADTQLALRRAMLLFGILGGTRTGKSGRTQGASAEQLGKLAAAFARPLLAVVALYRQHGRPAAEAEALLSAARRLDPMLGGFALRPPERQPRATPPRPARTRGPERAPRTRTVARPRPRSTQQVTLFAD